MKPATLLAALLSVSTVTTAWPWPNSNSGLEVIEAVEGMGRLFRRQDNNNNDKPSSSSPTAKSATTTDKKAPSAAKTGSSEATKTDSNKSSANTKSDSKSDKGAKTTGGTAASGSSIPTGTSGDGNQSAQTTEYDPRLPAGGVSMITPAPISGPQYYKIGDWVTFAWNYTSLSATPKAIDILASCSSAQQTYTIAMNQSVSGSKGEVLWDTGEYQKTATAPLLTNQYTLIIYDAAGSISDMPKAGYLGTQNTFTFGLYEGQQYTPWNDFNCATCNAALRMSAMERQTMAFLLAMAGITVVSFTWFATGVFGVL